MAPPATTVRFLNGHELVLLNCGTVLDIVDSVAAAMKTFMWCVVVMSPAGVVLNIDATVREDVQVVLMNEPETFPLDAKDGGKIIQDWKGLISLQGQSRDSDGGAEGLVRAIDIIQKNQFLRDARIVPPNFYLLSTLEAARILACRWDYANASINLIFDACHLRVSRSNVAHCSDAVIARMGFSSGIHWWDIEWDHVAHSGSTVGVALKDAATHCDGYVSMVSLPNVWGWDLSKGLIYGTQSKEDTPIKAQDLNSMLMAGGNGWKAQPFRVRCKLVCETGSLSFRLSTSTFATAVTHLPTIHGVNVYPFASTCWGNGRIAIMYLGDGEDEPEWVPEGSLFG